MIAPASCVFTLRVSFARQQRDAGENGEYDSGRAEAIEKALREIMRHLGRDRTVAITIGDPHRRLNRTVRG